MSDPIVTDISTLFTGGSRYVRYNTTSFLKYVFYNSPVHNQYFKWDGEHSGTDYGAESSHTKIWITSAYPDIPTVYPHIIVNSSGYTYEPTGFGAFTGIDKSRGIPWEFGGKNHFESIDINIYAMSQDEVEYITELVLTCFIHKALYNIFVKRTNIYPDIKSISVASITPTPIPNTDKFAWYGLVKIPCQLEWVSEIDFSDVESIASEVVTDTQE